MDACVQRSLSMDFVLDGLGPRADMNGCGKMESPGFWCLWFESPGGRGSCMRVSRLESDPPESGCGSAFLCGSRSAPSLEFRIVDSTRLNCMPELHLWVLGVCCPNAVVLASISVRGGLRELWRETSSLHKKHQCFLFPQGLYAIMGPAMSAEALRH